jgi:glutamate 5-kinase
MRARPSRRCSRFGALPVINENDTVATAEIRYGDNDRLAARVAQMTAPTASCCCRTSRASSAPTPTRIPDAQFIATVRHLTPQIEAMAGARCPDSAPAAWRPRYSPRRSPWRAGCHLCIAAGGRSIRCGASRRARAAPGSCRPPPRPRLASSGSPGPCSLPGSIMIDAGALKALQEGKSLLPAGVWRPGPL